VLHSLGWSIQHGWIIGFILLNPPSRPEKDHKAQILAFHQLLQDHPEHFSASDGGDPVKLVLIGGSRNDGDAKRIAALKDLVEALGIAVNQYPADCLILKL
jgi:hypothetical protein